jgi:hypothetical protein
MMLDFLKDHPFAVEAFFESSLVLSFAVPKEQLTALVPPCLSIDTFGDSVGFVAAAIVSTHDLRPKHTPKVFGHDFILIGYRVFVRYETSAGKRLRGLYILGSSTNKRLMERFGNVFTHYNYSTVPISVLRNGSLLSVSSPGLDVQIDTASSELPAASPFRDWKEARRFAGPLPFTFTYDARSQEVLIIEGVRQHWEPKPVTAIRSDVSFIETLGLSNVTLANAFLVENVPYSWKKGRRDKWKA